FSSRRRHTRLQGDWSSDVCSSDLYYTAKVEKGDISQVVQATGTINAVTTVQVGSQVSGTIAKLFADFNTQVTKDQVVAQIDPARSEERRVGKECRARRAEEQENRK